MPLYVVLVTTKELFLLLLLPFSTLLLSSLSLSFSFHCFPLSDGWGKGIALVALAMRLQKFSSPFEHCVASYAADPSA